MAEQREPVRMRIVLDLTLGMLPDEKLEQHAAEMEVSVDELREERFCSAECMAEKIADLLPMPHFQEEWLWPGSEYFCEIKSATATVLPPSAAPSQPPDISVDVVALRYAISVIETEYKTDPTLQDLARSMRAALPENNDEKPK